MYCGLLLLGDEADNRKAIERLESIFVLYQQIPFHSFIDGIYTTLIMAAFNIQDHDKVEEAYRRYKKSTRKKVVNPENDLTILGMYYSSKWLATGRSQYVKKLEAMLEQTRESHLHGTGKLISAVVEYYEIPIELV
jgi:predicted metal-binding protein